MLRHRLLRLKINGVHHSANADKDNFDLKEIVNTETYKKLLYLITNGGNTIYTDEDWQQLEKEIEVHGGGFLVRLMSVSKFSQVEFRICILIKLGFRPKQMALAVCKSKESVTSIRRRLSEKVLNTPFSSPKQWDNFINSL